MTPNSSIFPVAILLVIATPLPVQAEATTPSETAKIEALISHLEGLKGATFIRNGSNYDSKSAATFLRRKWQANKKEIKTAADFIAKAATGSSTSGNPYLIRSKDGIETPCRDYLTTELRKMEAASKAKE